MQKVFTALVCGLFLLSVDVHAEGDKFSGKWVNESCGKEFIVACEGVLNRTGFAGGSNL